MIAQADWFARRKYTGWGVTPKKWQGIVYVMVTAGIFSFLQAVNLNANLKLVLSGILAVFILVDILQAMMAIKMDEREVKIEAIAERNASWTITFSTAFSILYVATIGKEQKGLELLPVLMVPILLGVVAKGLTNYILDKKGV